MGVARSAVRRGRGLYATAYGRLVASLHAACGDRITAEEVAQEAFVRLLQRWPAVRHYEDPEGWTRRVAYRLLSNRQRDTATRARLLRAAGLDRSSELREADPGGRAVDVERALSRLTPDQRAVVVLHHMHQFSIEEVADHLKTRPGTVKSRLSRARAVLAPLFMEKVHD